MELEKRVRGFCINSPASFSFLKEIHRQWGLLIKGGGLEEFLIYVVSPAPRSPISPASSLSVPYLEATTLPPSPISIIGFPVVCVQCLNGSTSHFSIELDVIKRKVPALVLFTHY